jgi:ribose transport system permease protein
MATEATTSAAALAATKRKELTRSLIELAGMLPVLIVICILFAFLTPNFLTQNNIVNVVRQASINIVLAAGMTFVILTGGIDLAVGSVLGFTAVIAVVVSLLPGLSWAAVPIALLAGLVVGVLTGMTVAYIGLPPFIVTLGTYTAIRGAAYLVAGGTTVINSKIGFAWIGNGYVGPVPWLVIIALVVIAVSAFVHNGLTLMNVSFYWQLVIKGAVIVLAVMLDKLRTRGQAQ